MEQKLLSGFQEVAEYLQCSYRTIARLETRGELPEPLHVVDGIGRGKRRIWSIEQISPLKEKILDRKKYIGKARPKSV